MNSITKIGIGSAINRVDGREKVTGTAKYAAEYTPAGMVYGYVVSATIAKGSIAAIDEAAARSVPGVVEILTHANRPHIAWRDSNYQDEVAPPGSPFRALADAKIMFNGQPVAVVLAETFEAARYAASLVRVSYDAEPHNTDFDASLGGEVPAVQEALQLPPSEGARRCGCRPGCGGGVDLGRLPSRNRASQPDGDARDDRGVGR